MPHRDRKHQLNLMNRQKRRLEFRPRHFGAHLN
jgi:hypothetical protein